VSQNLFSIYWYFRYLGRFINLRQFERI
jgi:hypothetical protein